MKKLYILDASGYIYRSYYAIRNITNAKGQSTNALFGFIRSVQKLKKDFAPEYLVAVFDGPQSGQKREEIYADYKAHRTSTPPDLIYQIDWARQACPLMGISYLSVTGVEADDTMGSIAVWAAQQDFQVFLCTSDKDLCQLVNDRIFILNTFKENQILGEKEVEESFGVPPSKMIDYLAITGDASDNVPGLPGFGPKTAASLLQQYGSLDYLLSHPEVVSGKKQEILQQHAAQARLSRELVTIHKEVEFPKEIPFFNLRPASTNDLKNFYSEMNFNSLIKEMDQSGQVEDQHKAAPEEADVTYTLVDTPESLQALIDHIRIDKEVCLHTLGTAEQPFKAELIGISFCTCPRTAWYVPTNGKLGLAYVLEKLKPLLEDPAILFCGHNIKYDVQLLENYHIRLATFSFDTMLASYILNSHLRQHSLENLMLEKLNKTKKALSHLLGKGKKAITIDQVPVEEMALLCCQEADAICQLQQLLAAELEQRKLSKVFYDLELPLLRVLAKMERHGLYLDKPCLEIMEKELLKLLAELEAEIYHLAGEPFNINSPKQLSHILYTKLEIKPPRKTATGLSTDADVLDFLKDSYPIAGRILEYRQLEKLRSTYVQSLPFEVSKNTGRIHCTFNQTVAATGRLSCQDPNLQNIPIRSEVGKKIRTAFKPEKEGWSYLAADYSQIELRLLAHLSEDPQLIQAFNHNEDIHAHTAATILNIPLDQVTKEQRYQAKAVNFGIIYGQQAYGLSQELGIDVKEAAAFIERYFSQFSKVKNYVEQSKEKARQTGKALTLIGRERLIPEIHNKNMQIRAAAERLAMNTPLQGTAADLIKMAMLEIDKQIKKENLQGYMVLQIHDELIFEVPDHELPKFEMLVRKGMQEVFQLKVPLVVNIVIGKNWAEC